MCVWFQAKGNDIRSKGPRAKPELVYGSIIVPYEKFIGLISHNGGLFQARIYSPTIYVEDPEIKNITAGLVLIRCYLYEFIRRSNDSFYLSTHFLRRQIAAVL